MQRSFCSPHPCLASSHPSFTSSYQRRPQKLAASAEPQQPSQSVPCASHAKSSRPNPSHPQATEKFYTTHMHQPSQTAEQPRQACHCCTRAVLAHPTSHATAMPELRPRVRIRCFSHFANGHAARRPDARRDRWSRTHGRTLSSTNHHQPLQSHQPSQTASHAAATAAKAAAAAAPTAKAADACRATAAKPNCAMRQPCQIEPS